MVVFQFLSQGLFSLKSLGGIRQFLFGQKDRPDSSVGTNHRTLVALDTVVQDPFRNVDGNTAFFICGGTHRENPVRRKSGHWQLIALLGQHGTHHIFHEVRLVFFRFRTARCLCPALRVIDLNQIFQGFIDGGKVHINDLLTLFAEQLLDLIFQVSESVIYRYHIGQLEESRLHDHVDPAPEAYFTGDFNRIDVVELEFFLRDGASQGSWNLFFHVLQCPGRVEDENSTVFDAFKQIVGFHISVFVTGNVIGRVNQVSGLDRFVAEP